MKIVAFSSLFFFIIACNSKLSDTGYLLKVCEDPSCEIGSKTGYIDQQGDTIISLGKYRYCYTDTLRNFAIVLDKDGICKAINKKEETLYQVYWYDNGPDYLSDGLFRIIIDEKIGYANEQGEIVIEPQFRCAYPFEEGKAKVAYNCDLISDGEYTLTESEEWIYIDKDARKLR